MTHLRRRVRAPGTYFVTSNTWERRELFRKEAPAQLFLECLFHYRNDGNFLLHEFVLMPDHFHLLLTPATDISLERTLQFIKGGSSHRIHKELSYKFPIWQTGFDDHRIRSPRDYEHRRTYIRDNPVREKLAEKAEEYAFSSASPQYKSLLDAWPPAMPSAAKAVAGESTAVSRAEARPRQGVLAKQAAGLKPGPDRQSQA